MTAILDFKDVDIALGERAVVTGASFSAACGEFIGLVGPNGAGKSTLLRAGAGLIAVAAGERRLQGDSFDNITLAERAQQLAYLPQARPIFWSLAARNIVALGRFTYGAGDNGAAPAVEKAMREAGVLELAERPAAELSGGELARIHLARTLAAETPLILADEPIAALDPAHQFSVMALLRKKADSGNTVIAALHDLPLAIKYCTRIIVMHDGRIAADGGPDILTGKIAADVFNVRLQHTLENGVALTSVAE